MSLSKFNGKVVLSGTNIVDASVPPGSKTKWTATFSFSDAAGVYLGTQVAVGDVIVLDTSGVDVGTVTYYVISAVVSSAFDSFRVTMDYLASNANPGGAPDITGSANTPGFVGRRSTAKGLTVLPDPSVQLLPSVFSTQTINNNMFDVIDAGIATTLTGGAAGTVLYQSAANTTAFSAAGTAGQVLLSGGTGAPTWSNASSLTVSSASSATNLAGGVAGAIHYQSAVGTTAFTAAGAAGQILTSGGAGAPTWTTPSSLTVSSASTATTATNLAGGVAGAVHYQSAAGTTGFTAAGTSGQVLISGGTGAPTWTNASTLTVSTATTSTNLAGAAWAIPYQSALNTTAMLAAGTAGQVLTSNGSAAPSWQAVSATTATTQAYGDNTTNIATTAFVDRLRSSPTSANTTAALTDRGKTLVVTAGVTVPANIFAAGDCFSVYNSSAASITLTSGAGLTLYLVGTATTGNRTLAQRGIATVYYVSATEAVITGGGLS